MVTQLRTEPGSTGCQTCTLTATPKSQAQWHGSQSTYSSVVTITLPSPFANARVCFTHTHFLGASTNCTSPIQRAPHTSASPIYGVRHTGVNLPGGPSHSFTGTARLGQYCLAYVQQ